MCGIRQVQSKLLMTRIRSRRARTEALKERRVERRPFLV